MHVLCQQWSCLPKYLALTRDGRGTRDWDWRWRNSSCRHSCRKSLNRFQISHYSARAIAYITTLMWLHGSHFSKIYGSQLNWDKPEWAPPLASWIVCYTHIYIYHLVQFCRYNRWGLTVIPYSGKFSWGRNFRDQTPARENLFLQKFFVDDELRKPTIFVEQWIQ